MTKFLVTVLLICSGFTAKAVCPQKPFTPFSLGIMPSVHAADSQLKEKPHSPRKASIYSAVLPGLGQAYNRKYWKIPIIYAAMGTTGYLFYYNRTEMNKRQNALKLMLDGDSSTVPSSEFASIPVNILRQQRNNYRSNADLNLILFSGFYVLNIIDAVVDAHFYKFNIDKPLAARKEKRWHLYSDRVGHTPVMGFGWRF